MKGKEKCGDVELNSVFFPVFFFFFNFNYSPLLQKLTCNIQVIREFYKTIVCLTGKQLQSTWLVEKHYKGEKCMYEFPAVYSSPLSVLIYFIAPTTGRRPPAVEEGSREKGYGTSSELSLSYLHPP